MLFGRALRSFPLLAVTSCAAAMGGAGGTESTHSLVGVKAPEFSRRAVVGEGSLSIGDAKGKVVVVDFWATYCEPCQKSLPKLDELQARHASDVVVLALSEDDDTDGIAAFVRRAGVKLRVGWDENKAIGQKYQVEAMPSTYVIDRKGVVRFVHRGYHDGDDQGLEREISGLL